MPLSETCRYPSQVDWQVRPEASRQGAYRAGRAGSAAARRRAGRGWDSDGPGWDDCDLLRADDSGQRDRRIRARRDTQAERGLLRLHGIAAPARLRGAP